MLKLFITRNSFTVGSAWISRILNAGISIFSIRIFLSGVGPDQYAIFLILSSLMAWYMLADFGVGVSLQNYISEQRAKQEKYEDYIVTGGVLALLLLVFLICLLYVASPFASKFIFSSFVFLGETQKTNLFFIAGLLFIGISLGSIAYKVFYAQIKGYFSNIVSAISSALGLLALSVVMSSKQEDKLLIGLIAYFAPSCLLAVFVFSVQIFFAIRDAGKFKFIIFKNIIQRAWRFSILYLMHAAVVNLDFIILAKFLPPLDVVKYGILTRIFSFSAFFYTSIYSALWPNFSEAIYKGNWKFVKLILIRAILFSSFLILAYTIFIIIFIDDLISFISPESVVTVPIELLLLLGGYHLVIAWVHGFGIPLQSMNDLKGLLFWTPIQAVISVLLQVVLVQHFGLYGIIWALLLSFLLTMAWLLPIRVLKHSRIASI
ncbi:Membrane protein involved in the export of O-antigen and teichoic acid [Polynucleobacter meluiroseus]|uniref:Membrane protein involved in the export of O-antigen and teichoic acid n=1 Tax=Polynucleobacter meluiroseus TaxID=1938814 RepID=A0A240E3K6_9BURK|nr:MATE family efflux transporter [Polynucleobacter meluiroseus]SNX29111.1 Membrane protein involved in the export of O-antigen and teichoic acid [Polynucleobacter meluiroseus]